MWAQMKSDKTALAFTFCPMVINFSPSEHAWFIDSRSAKIKKNGIFVVCGMSVKPWYSEYVKFQLQPHKSCLYASTAFRLVTNGFAKLCHLASFVGVDH